MLCVLIMQWVRAALVSLQDPVSDLEIVHNELRLKDMERIDSLIETTKKLKGRGLRKEQVVELELCERIKAWLESARDIRFGIPGDVGEASRDIPVRDVWGSQGHPGRVGKGVESEDDRSACTLTLTRYGMGHA